MKSPCGARIQKHCGGRLHCSSLRGTMPLPSETPRLLRFGVFEVDPRAGELRKSGLRIKLQDQPLRVLVMLLEHPGRMVTREELQRRLWEADTFVDFDHSLNSAIKKLREALGDQAENPRFIETLHRRGYRFIAPVEGQLAAPEMGTSSQRDADSAGTTSTAKAGAATGIGLHWKLIIPATAAVALSIGSYFYFHHTPKLTEKNTIVLADFVNSTGDAVFDGTLRQGLSVQLEQSPFLTLLSEEQVQRTLHFMGLAPDVRLTPQIAREICQRTQSTAVLDGTISLIGSQYLLTLKAVNCSNGESLASAEAQAEDKNHVLGGLGKMATDIRSKLGESISSVRRWDTPLYQATTSSLEALQAYSLGVTASFSGNYAAAIPIYQRAIRLDPKFAMAYANLAGAYENLGEPTPAAQNVEKAYELREKVSEREKLSIEGEYESTVTGDLEEARRTYELWTQTYPRDSSAHNNLGYTYLAIGQYERAYTEFGEAHRLNSTAHYYYSNYVFALLLRNRFDDARTAAQEAQAQKLDSPDLRYLLYLVAFQQGDVAAMERQVSYAVGQPAYENWFLALEADTAGYGGKLLKAREFTRRAAESASHADQTEVAATYEAAGALREGLFGNKAEARRRATEALRLSRGRDVKYFAAMALAVGGDEVSGQGLAEELNKQFPNATWVQFNYLPALRAQLALGHNDAAKAIEVLRPIGTYDLGSHPSAASNISFYPVYVRGEAYLTTHQGTEAAAEFQKILDHRGIVSNSPIGALAHLQLGRAYAMQGDTTKARAAYQDFLSLWKDADSDISILKEAKAEYAKLQ
jgi:eukaryotic-like serine/threonine-protein kinase